MVLTVQEIRVKGPPAMAFRCSFALQHAEPPKWSQFTGVAFSFCEHERLADSSTRTIPMHDELNGFVNQQTIFEYVWPPRIDNSLLIH
jgi:hypothetical protein